MAYCRAELWSSLGKSVTVLDPLLTLSLSHDGTLGDIRWTAEWIDPVVRRLFELRFALPKVRHLNLAAFRQYVGCLNVTSVLWRVPVTAHLGPRELSL